MYIVHGDEVVEELRKKYTVLELETFVVDGEEKVIYCVLTADSLLLGDLTDLESLIDQHQRFIAAWKQKNYDEVTRIGSALRRHFNGELDSFYDIMMERAINANPAIPLPPKTTEK